jgi:MFS family permease
MVVNYGGGLWLDRMRGSEQQAYGYTVIFMFAIVCAAGGSILLSRQQEPRMVVRERLPIREVFRRPLQHREFRRFMLLIMLWHVALGVAAPFFSAHALTTLHLPFKTLAMFDVITAAISMAALGPWGQLADRIGQRRVLMICIAGVIILPWCWVVATPSMIWPLYINAVLSGIWWSGLNLALSNRLMEQVPVSARGAYLAVFAASTGLTYFLASLGAGSVADALSGVQLNVAGLTLNNYQVLFITSSLVRCVTLVLGRKAL